MMKLDNTSLATIWEKLTKDERAEIIEAFNEHDVKTAEAPFQNIEFALVVTHKSPLDYKPAALHGRILALFMEEVRSDPKNRVDE